MIIKKYIFFLLLLGQSSPSILSGMSRREILAAMAARGYCAAPQPVKRPNGVKRTMQECAAGVWSSTRPGRLYADKADDVVAAYFGYSEFFVAYCRRLPICPWDYFDEQAYELASRANNEALYVAYIAQNAQEICDADSIHSDDEPLQILVASPHVNHGASRTESVLAEGLVEHAEVDGTDTDSDADDRADDDEDCQKITAKKYPRHKSSRRRRLSEVQCAEVRALYSDSSYTCQEIADLVKCSLRSVQNIAQKNKDVHVVYRKRRTPQTQKSVSRQRLAKKRHENP